MSAVQRKKLLACYYELHNNMYTCHFMLINVTDLMWIGNLYR